MSKISFDGLREALQDGFEEFLDALPQGEDEILELGPLDPLEEAKEALFVEFVRAWRSLRRCGYSSAQIRVMLEKDGLAHRILVGDESWAHQFLD